MRFLFVLVKYFWFNWSIKKNESVRMALLKSNLAVYSLFALYSIVLILLIELIFKISILSFLAGLIPVESYFSKKVIPAILLVISIFVLERIASFFPNRKVSPIKSEFNRYIEGEKELTKKEVSLIRIFLIFTALLPVIICIYLWICVLLYADR